MQDNRSVRLVKPNGQWDTSSEFYVGDIWDIDFTPMTELTPPHTEDILVNNFSYVGAQAELATHILSRLEPWRGDIDQIFDRFLGFTGNNNGFMSQLRGVTNYSTWFWVPDKDLTLRNDGKHYDYPRKYSNRGMPYVGEPAAIPVIPAGTLVRLSLARWWKPHDIEDFEERCYLQLSGWF